MYFIDRKCQSSRQSGELAQLVERPLSMREVRGSKPWFSRHFFSGGDDGDGDGGSGDGDGGSGVLDARRGPPRTVVPCKG